MPVVMSFALRLLPDGTTEEISWTGKDSYNTLKKALDGAYMEAVNMPRINGTLWVDEEFLFKPELERNILATKLAIALGYPFEYFVMGPAVLTGGVNLEGNTIGLTPNQLHTIKALVEEILK